jgi:GNAT superfamily N-acetyltransferase
MAVSLRRAQYDDIQGVAEVYRRSILDIYQRHGFAEPQIIPSGTNPFYAFVLREEPDGFFVAEDAGRVVGAAFSWVRGTSWFLSHLFILPEYQGQGIGKGLLKRTLEYCTKAGATHRAVITMAFNPASIAIYLGNGMYPIENIYLMRASNISKGEDIERNDAVSYERIEPAFWRSGDLSHIDMEVLGMSRMRHHQYFLQDRDAPCYLFRHSSQVVAYGYLWPDGRIGPVAALNEAPYDVILKTIIGLARKSCPVLTMMVPGSNRVAMEVAIAHGFSIILPYLILTSQPFGAWDRYLFHSPGMM